MTAETKQIIKNETKRLMSRKFIAWTMCSGLFAIALGVYLRTLTMAVWQSYVAIENGRPVVEALGALNIFKDFMFYFTGFYGLMTLTYVGSNLAEKWLGLKAGVPGQQ